MAFPAPGVLRARILGLRTRLILAFLVITLVPVGLLGVLNDRAMRAALTDSANHALLGAAMQTAVGIDNFIGASLEAINTEAQLPVLIKYLTLSAEQRTGSMEEAQVTYILHTLSRKDPYILSYALLDRQGWDLIDTYAPEMGRDNSAREHFRAVLETNRPVVAPLEFSPASGAASFYLSAPVRDALTGEIIGVLRVRYKAGILQYLIAQNTGRAGHESYAVLVDEHHVRLAHGTQPELVFKSYAPLDPERLAALQAAGRMPPGTPEELATHLPDVEAGLQTVEARPVFTARANAFGGQLAATAVVRLKTAPWLVLTRQPQAVFLAPLEAQTRATLWLALVIAAGAAAVGVVVSQRLAGPIVRLTAVAKAVTGGDLSARAVVETRDEIGTLAGAFNAMVGRLQQTLAGLEQRVTERTAELAQRVEQLDLINHVGRNVTSQLYLDALLSHTAGLIRATFGYYAVLILLVDKGADEICLSAAATAEGVDMPERGLRLKIRQDSIIGHVASSGEPLVVEDVSAEPHYYYDERLPRTRSELALPLRVGDSSTGSGRVLGVLDLESAESNAFGSETVQVLRTLADQIAIAIRNAQLYQAEQARRQWAESLEQAGRVLSSSLDLHEMPGRVLEQLAAVVPYERGSLILQEDHAMRIVAQRGFPEDERVISLCVPIREGDVFQQVAETRRPLLIEDVTQTPGWQQVEWLPLDRSWMGVPLISRERVIGMLSLTRRQAGAFSPDEATVVSTFAVQAAIALENAGLYDEIKRFNEQLEQMVQQRTEELNKAYQTLEKLDKTKSDFIEIAAHELRTPLTLIKGYAQMLEETVQDKPTRELLNGILSGQTRLNEIINSMLDVSKSACQVMEVEKRPVNLGGVIESVCGGFKAALQERQLTLTLVGLDSLPVIQADPDLLYKVFYHLVVNAIKYTPNGGSIAVSGRAISEVEAMPVVEVVVSDSGIGIDPAHHELIFEKFYQTGQVSFHSSGKTKFKGGGPGLGLSIARGIVQAHGGHIWVESEGYDEARCPGSRFHVCLPVEAPG